MGAHHFKIILVPPDSKILRNAAGEYEGDFLRSFQISDVVIGRLRKVFPKTNHWGDIEEYLSENEWGSDLRICRSDNRQIEDITVRFASCSDSLDKLREIIDIAKQAGCFLLLEASGKVVAPEFNNVFEALESHYSYQFGKTPLTSIERAANEMKPNDN